MRLTKPARCAVSLDTGQMTGLTKRYEKRLADLDGLYENAAAFAETLVRGHNPVVYDVCEFRPSDRSGDMIFGITHMIPGRIGREFFLTKGHIHAKSDRPEIYYGQRGHGVMQLESPDGETQAIEIGPQVICYVPPFWIHRTVNVGAEELVMMFSYPADSGQDYGIITRSGGLRHRVMATADGGWTLVENPDYRPRSTDVVDALYSAVA